MSRLLGESREDVALTEEDFALRLLLKASDDAHQRGLATPRPEEARDLAVRKGEGHIVQRTQGAERLGHVLDANLSHGVRLPLSGVLRRQCRARHVPRAARISGENGQMVRKNGERDIRIQVVAAVMVTIDHRQETSFACK